MALSRQTIDIPFGGLNTKVDPKLLPLGKSLALENAEFSNVVSLNKRNGYTELSRSILGGGAPSTSKVLSTLGDDLVMNDGSTLYSYSTEASTWVSRGACPLAGIKTRRVPASAAAQTIATPSTFQYTNGFASAGGYTAVIWSTDSGGVFASVYGTTTGAVIVSCTQLAVGALRLKVAAVSSGTKIFLLYPDAPNMKMQYFDTSSPASGLSSPTNLVTNVNGDAAFDAKDFNGSGSCALSYRNTTGGGQISTVLFTAAGVTVGPTVTAVVPTNQIGVVVSAAGDVYTAYRQTATLDLYCFCLSSSLSSVFAATVVETLTSNTRIVGIEQSANSILWVYGDATATGFQTRKASISNAGVVTGVGLIVRGALVASGLFSHNSNIYFIAQSEPDLGNMGAWMFDTSGNVCGGALMGFAASGTAYACPGVVASLGSGQFMTATMASFSTNGPQVPVELRIEMDRRCLPVPFAQSLYIPSAQLWQYDGTQVVEHGFLTPPTVSGSDVGGGSLADGDYGIAAVYEWYDSVGRRHQSAPSVPATVTVSSGGTGKIRATISTLRMTQKTGVKIVLYVTDNGGSTFYRLSSASNNKVSVDTLTIDYSTTSSLTDNEILYTNGGVLENTAPPAMQSLVVKGRRLYGVTFDGNINYTKDLVDGEGAAFVAETLVRELLDDSGDEWAIAAMDASLIAIGENSLQALSGDGLNDTGTNDTLSQPQLIASDAGRQGNTPVLSTDQGVWFKGPRGLRLLTRSFAIDPMAGAEVDDYSTLSLVSAVVVPEKSQIRFGHSDGVTLVFDYLAGQWSVSTNHTQTSATLWQGDYMLSQSDGDVWQQSAGFVDNISTSIALVVETPWIKLSGIQGFQRLQYCSLLGVWKSGHQLRLKVYYDYSDTAAETIEKDMGTGYSAGDPLQLRHHLGKKCEAVRFRVEDFSPTGTKESFSLTGMSLEIGVKKGLFKLSASKTI